MHPERAAARGRRVGVALGAAALLACAGSGGAPPPAAPAAAARPAGATATAGAAPAGATTARELGLDTDPTGAWERSMSRLDAANVRGDAEAARAALLEAAALALAFEDIDVRVDQTDQAVDSFVAAEQRQKRTEAALGLLRSIEAEAQRRGADQHEVALHALEHRGLLQLETGDRAGGEAALRAFLAASDSRFGPDTLPALAVRTALAASAVQDGRVSEARRLAEGVLESRAAKPDAPEKIEARVVLGALLASEGKLAEAQEQLKQALALAGSRAGSPPVVQAQLTLARVQLAAGDPRSAESSFQEAERIARAGNVASPELLAEILRGRAAVAYERGDVLRAIDLGKQALDLSAASAGESSPAALESLIALALFHVEAGDREGAEPLLGRARPLLDTVDLAPAAAIEQRGSIAIAEVRLGDEKQALRHASEAVRQAEQVFGADAFVTARARGQHALVLVSAGKVRAAAPDAEAALQVLGTSAGPDQPLTAGALGLVARVRAEQGRQAESLALFGQALPVLEQAYGPRAPDLAQLLEWRAQALRLAGRPDTAAADEERLAGLRQSYRAGAAPGAAGAGVEVAEYNFRIRPTTSAWRSVDASRAGSNTKAAFQRQRPDAAFLVAVTPLVRGILYTPEYVVESAKQSLASQYSSVDVEEVAQRSLDGVDGSQMLFRAVTRQGQTHRIALWVGAHGGWFYWLALYSDDAALSTPQLRSLSDEMLRGFSLIDARPDPVAVQTGPRFESPRFHYKVDLSQGGWGPWRSQAADQPDAEFGAVHPAGGIFLVIPVALLGTHPDERILQRAMLSLVNEEWPAAPRSLEVGGLRGIETDVARTTPSARYRGRARVLAGEGAAYAVLALVPADSPDADRLLSAVAAIEYPSAGPGPIDRASFTPTERRRHARTMNAIGLAYYGIGNRGDALRFLALAVELDPDSLVALQNLVHVQVESGRYDEVIRVLEGDPSRLSDRVELLAYRGLARERSGDPAGALADYERAFALGLENDDFFGNYAELLWQAGERERALAALDGAIAAHGSIPLRVTRASLHRQAGEFDAAIRELEEIEAGGTKDVAVSSQLIAAYFEGGRHHDAIAACERHAREFGPSADLLVMRARSEFALGLYREADASLDAALALEPGSAVASEFKSALAARLGRGDASLLREPIDPVPYPAELAQAAPIPEEELAAHGAGYLRRIDALHFEPGVQRRRTLYLEGVVTGARGADELSTLRIDFDPVWERVWLNDLVVRDASGKVVARKEDASVYVLDDDSRPGIAASGKVLHVAVPGLAAGSRFEAAVTREDVQAPQRFPLIDHVFSTSVPVSVAALFVSGVPAHLAEWSSAGVTKRALGDGVAWIARDPRPSEWEPMQDDGLSSLPRVLVADAAASWEGLAREYSAELAPYLAADPAVSALADPALGGEGAPAERARRAADWVQTQLSYKALLFGVRARIPHTPAEILRNRWGDCKDHATLLLQLLRRAGVPAQLALVSLSRPIEPSVPSLDQFDHMIVYCEGCGGSGFIDATDKDLEPEIDVPRGLAGRFALVLDPEKPRLLRIPDYRADLHTIRIDRVVSVRDDGSASVVEDAVFSGLWGASFRGALRGVQRGEWEKTLQQYLFDNTRGSVLKHVQAANVDDPAKPLELKLEYEIGGWFTADSGGLTGRIPALLETSYLQATPISERSTPFEVRYPLRLESTARLRLPEGFSLRGGAPAAARAADARFVAFQGRAETESDALTLHFEASRTPGVFAPSDYALYYEESRRALGFFDRSLELVHR